MALKAAANIGYSIGVFIRVFLLVALALTIGEIMIPGIATRVIAMVPILIDRFVYTLNLMIF